MSKDLTLFKVKIKQQFFFTAGGQDYCLNPGRSTLLPADNEYIQSLVQQGYIEEVKAPEPVANTTAPSTGTSKDTNTNPGGPDTGNGSGDASKDEPIDYSKMGIDDLRDLALKRKEAGLVFGFDLSEVTTKKTIIPLLTQLDELEALVVKAKEVGADVEGLTTKEDINAAIELAVEANNK